MPITLLMLLSLAAGLGLGALGAILAFRSKVEMARLEARSEGQGQTAQLQAELKAAQLERDQIKTALGEAGTREEALRQAAQASAEAAARLHAQAEGEQRRAQDLEKRLTMADGQVAQMAAAVQQMNDQYAQAKAREAELQAILEGIGRERDGLRQAHDALSEDHQQAQRDLRSMAERAASLAKQVEGVQRLAEESLAAEQAKASDLTQRLANQEQAHRELATRLQATEQQLATAQADAARLSASLQASQAERDSLQALLGQAHKSLEAAQTELRRKAEEVAGLQQSLEGLQQTSEARLEALQEAQRKLGETFQALSAKALQANNEQFLQLARTQLQGAQAESAKDLEARQQAIAQLLAPVHTTLATMQTEVQKLATDRASAEANLGAHIQHLVQAQQGLQAETAKLSNAFQKPEVRGQWGEIQLRNVVEYAGMKEYVDFELQSSLEVEGQKRRPDMLVKLPGGKCLAVDAKTTARAYLEALAEQGPAREQRLKDVAGQVRTQIEALGRKGYYDGLVESPDFVVLFLPLEALFSLALEQDRTLLDFAAQRNVLLASPTTLLALLKSAAYGWTQERIQANAEEIQKQGAELVKRISGMATHVEDLRSALERSVKAFNAFAGSLESRVMVTSQRMAALGIQPALGGGTGKKPKPLLTRAPQALHADLSGLPKLGIAGTEPIEDAEILEDDATEPAVQEDVR